MKKEQTLWLYRASILVVLMTILTQVGQVNGTPMWLLCTMNALPIWGFLNCLYMALGSDKNCTTD